MPIVVNKEESTFNNRPNKRTMKSTEQSVVLSDKILFGMLETIEISQWTNYSTIRQSNNFGLQPLRLSPLRPKHVPILKLVDLNSILFQSRNLVLGTNINHKYLLLINHHFLRNCCENKSEEFSYFL